MNEFKGLRRELIIISVDQKKCSRGEMDDGLSTVCFWPIVSNKQYKSKQQEKERFAKEVNK